MRVLHLGKYWRPHGGIETFVKTLCKSLAAQGVDVVDLVSSLDSTGSHFEADGYTVVESPTLGIYFSTSISPAMILTASRLHKEKPFDVIHLHFPDPMSHLVSLALPKEIPRVITWHSDIVKQQHLLQIYKPFLRAEVMRSKAIVVATSSHFATSNQIPNCYPRHQKYVIPYGIDLVRFIRNHVIDKKVAILKEQAQNQFTIFAVGRHVEYKGFEYLIWALQFTSARLVLGGDGPQRQRLEQLVSKLGLHDRVVFTGSIDEDDLIANYHACDVFCMPSVTPNEAFGIVQVEAMACNKPVINTQLGNGVNEVSLHMHSGLTVPPRDPMALAQAIETLKNDANLRTRLGLNAEVRAKQNYSTFQLASKHIDLYQTIL